MTHNHDNRDSDKEHHSQQKQLCSSLYQQQPSLNSKSSDSSVSVLEFCFFSKNSLKLLQTARQQHEILDAIIQKCSIPKAQNQQNLKCLGAADFSKIIFIKLKIIFPREGERKNQRSACTAKILL